MTKKKLSKKRSLDKDNNASQKRGYKPMERAQIWSIDVLLATVIFISIMIIFYVTIHTGSKPTIEDLQAEAAYLKTEFEQNRDYSFITEDQINSTKFEQFVDATTLKYEDVKDDLGIKGDFCIYLEDENGNLVIIRNSTGANLTGVGNENINISGTLCGKPKDW
jgi:hypothetical protein